LSYLSSFVVVVLGVLIGWYVTSVNNVVIWIVTALWGGYTASNVLKWYWWRFNGYGYFWGMVAGMGSALTIPPLIAKNQALQDFAHSHSINLDISVSFVLVFILSLVGCFAGTWLSAPEDEEILKDFYRRVRPWGFWGPILKKVQQEDPSFQRNKDFFRDVFNIAVGMIWQIALVVLPMYIVTWRLGRAAVTFAVVAVTSLLLKVFWYDHLKELEHINQVSISPATPMPELNSVAK
jgi:hypothetical protein